ncbi:thioredoxin [Eubacteriales bacterium OttesenSCG-928-N13]|nr:thioredoxin [Eubacteriales bacterium OttesenSCG-928-N13]
MINFTSADLKPDALKGKGLVLVDFWASWCGPCRMVAPIIEQLAQDYQGKVTIGKLNVEEQPEASVDYRVENIPTMILFKDGEILETMIGARGKPALVEMLDSHL